MHIKKNYTKKTNTLQVFLILVLVGFLLLLGFNWETIHQWFGKLFKKHGKVNDDLNIKFDNLRAKYQYKSTAIITVGNLETDLQLFVRAKEGGITNNSHDSANSHPSPWVYVDKKTKKIVPNPHTNIGVTYQTFIDSSKTLGYQPTKENFFDMPVQAVWLPIFTKDYLQHYLNKTNNKLINYTLGLWAWGSGPHGADLLLKAYETQFGDLQKQVDTNPALTFQNLMLFRIAFLERISDKDNPKYAHNSIYTKGWVNTALKYYDSFKQYV